VLSGSSEAGGARVGRVVVATPCFGGMAHADFTRSLMSTMLLLERNSVPCGWINTTNSSMVSQARDELVAMFLAARTPATSSSSTRIKHGRPTLCWRRVFGGQAQYRLRRLISGESDANESGVDRVS
jgi:hypothetical protein